MKKQGVLATLVLLYSGVVAAGDVELESAWVRALPPVKQVTAAYVTVVNSGAEDVVITGGRVAIARAVEIHRTREVDGLMRMERLDSLVVPAGGRQELAPGGAHLMLFDLTHMPQPPEQLELCLELASGEELCTTAETRKDAPPGSHHH